MSKSRRVDRVSSLLKKEITLIIMNDLQSEIISNGFIDLTKLEISRDLQYCRIYVTTGGDKKICEVVEYLNTSRKTIRNLLSQRIDMRRIPEITFKEDKIIEKGLNVLKILEQIKEESDSKKSVVVENQNEQN